MNALIVENHLFYTDNGICLCAIARRLHSFSALFVREVHRIEQHWHDKSPCPAGKHAIDIKTSYRYKKCLFLIITTV